jgi:hypothetical protein
MTPATYRRMVAGKQRAAQSGPSPMGSPFRPVDRHAA